MISQVSPPPHVIAGIASIAGIAHVRGLLAGFEPTSLADMGGAALLDRVDTKYMMPAAVIRDVLDRLRDDYRVLEVGGDRLSLYRTQYFDTHDLRMYHAHHNGRTPRYKVRVRSYGGAERFLELKVKTNKARTRKIRVPLAADAAPLDRLGREGWLANAPFSASDLSEAVVIEYSRITLIGRTGNERITVDLGLTVRRGGSIRSFPDVVIAEVKQERKSRSAFPSVMRGLGLRPGALSKYCIAIAALEPAAKTNLFRRVLNRIEALDAAGHTDH
jgi:hypothetical protein